MGVDDEIEYDYKAIDFLSGMLAGATTSKNINKALETNADWEPFLFCDGPHLLGPILILRKPATD
jgi:hypothetical protein